MVDKFSVIAISKRRYVVVQEGDIRGSTCNLGIFSGGILSAENLPKGEVGEKGQVPSVQIHKVITKSLAYEDAIQTALVIRYLGNGYADDSARMRWPERFLEE